jgi:hypothetical protein
MKVGLVLVLCVIMGCSTAAVQESSKKKDFPEAIIKERLKELRQ